MTPPAARCGNCPACLERWCRELRPRGHGLGTLHPVLRDGVRIGTVFVPEPLDGGSAGAPKRGSILDQVAELARAGEPVARIAEVLGITRAAASSHKSRAKRLGLLNHVTRPAA